MIGRLQTEQDKNRLLDGLKSAAGGVDVGNYDRIISGLGKRVFLLHNVHESKRGPVQHTLGVELSGRSDDPRHSSLL